MKTLRHLTRQEENDAIRRLIAKSSLDEYVTLWNLIGYGRLNEALVSRDSSVTERFSGTEQTGV